MYYFFLLLMLLFYSCNNEESSYQSIHSFIDNEISGNPIIIEVINDNNPSIKIHSDFLNRYNEGNTLLYGGVYADLFSEEGIKTSEMYSDTAIIFNQSDSVKAIGNIILKSVKGFKLHTHEIILYNDSKLVKSDHHIMFTSNENDTLYGKGFWSNFDMSNFQILKPIGHIVNYK